MSNLSVDTEDYYRLRIMSLVIKIHKQKHLQRIYRLAEYIWVHKEGDAE